VVETVGTDRVVELVHDGAQLLEVLPPSAYEEEHLPGATNIALPALTREAVADLDPQRPVVVYCYDTECDLSARGAALLEAYDFAQVYDYTGSKTEWLGFGHPAEGTVPAAIRAGAIADPDVVCVGPDTPVGALDHRADLVVVVDDQRVVLGTIRPASLGPVDRTAIDVLQPGPATVRPSITAVELASSMDEAGQDHVLVTLLDGRLVGLIRREDLVVDA
jgi:rhodanese-related sulfurtransferase